MRQVPGSGGDIPLGVAWNPVERNWQLGVPWRSGLAPADASNTSCSFCPGGGEEPAGNSPHLVSSRYPFLATPDGAAIELHKVLFFSPSHERNLEALTISELVQILDCIGAECEKLLVDPAVQSVYVFQASGPLFGGSVSHPHLQILGLPFVPTKLVPDYTDGCILCTEFERNMVCETRDFILMVPPWSRLPYEMVIAPRQHLPRLSKCDTEQIAELISTGLHAAKRLLSKAEVPYTLNVMSAPKSSGYESDGRIHPGHHFRIEIVPYCTDSDRIRQIVAIESGVGIILNPTPPTQAAERLRGYVCRGAN
ncbi:hypothetical protein ACWEKT_20515 [Nocardia takedensis]